MYTYVMTAVCTCAIRTKTCRFGCTSGEDSHDHCLSCKTLHGPLAKYMLAKTGVTTGTFCHHNLSCNQAIEQESNAARIARVLKAH